MAQGNRTHKRGHRKCLYRDSMVEEAYKLGALGLTTEEIAAFWNVGKTTLWRYCKKHPELEMQINKGKNEADMTVVQALLNSCREGNVTAAIFWLKNRQGHKWQDVKKIDAKGFKGTSVNVTQDRVLIFTDVDEDETEETEDKILHAEESPERFGNKGEI